MYHPLTTLAQRDELWAMFIQTLGSKHAERAQAVLQDLKNAEKRIAELEHEETSDEGE